MKPIRNAVRGFTLIELMIAVAVIAILASIAYPSYVEHVRKSHRANAQAMMMEDVQFLERYFTTNSTYVGAVIPRTQEPENGTANYTLSTPTLTATTYVVQAAPTGTFSDPTCGTLTINQAGVKAKSGTGTLAECWRN
jgi:type IV pilus assembly protein PilE